MKFHLASFLFLPLAVIADTNALPTLAPAYGQIPPTFWEQHGAIILIGSLALLAVVSLIIWMLLRPKPPVIVPPGLLARLALTKLQGQPEDGKLLSEVSQILRRYFSATFGLPATEMTTAEFCAALTAHEKIGAELAPIISSLLRVCDKDKFSQKIIAPPINAVDRARELIVLAEDRRQRNESVPGAATSHLQNAVGNQQTQNHSDVAASGDERTP